MTGGIKISWDSTTCSSPRRTFFTAITAKLKRNQLTTTTTTITIFIYGENIWEVNVVVSQKPDLRANAIAKLKTIVTLGIFPPTHSGSQWGEHIKAGSAFTYWAILAIHSEVKSLKELVTTLKETVELVEVDPEVEENPVDDRDKDDSGSLSTRVAKLGSTPTEQTKEGTKSLL